MIEKLKCAYINCLYKISLFGTGLLNVTMLHLMQIQGLDPKSDPQLNKIKKLVDLFNSPTKSFNPTEDYYTTHPAIQRMKDAVKRRTDELQTFGSIGKIKRMAPKSDIPESSEVLQVTKSFKETFDELMEKYKPAYEANLPPGTSVVEVCKVEDEEVFETLDFINAAKQSQNHLEKNKKMAIQKSKKPAKKAIKKLIKKNKKK